MSVSSGRLIATRDWRGLRVKAGSVPKSSEFDVQSPSGSRDISKQILSEKSFPFDCFIMTSAMKPPVKAKTGLCRSIGGIHDSMSSIRLTCFAAFWG
jgi:hypothetical protein